MLSDPVFLPGSGSGSGFKIYLDPDPVSALKVRRNIIIITEDRQRISY